MYIKYMTAEQESDYLIAVIGHVAYDLEEVHSRQYVIDALLSVAQELEHERDKSLVRKKVKHDEV